MLYLVRKLDASIIINNDIEIKVIGLQRNLAKLSITSPKNTKVFKKTTSELDLKTNEHNSKPFLRLSPQSNEENDLVNQHIALEINASIIINDYTEVKLVEVKRTSIKLGIAFPPEVSVLRKEIHDKIANQTASL